MLFLSTRKSGLSQLSQTLSPLKSLIANQIRECGRFVLSSCKLEAENVESLKKECNFDIIIFDISPEVFESFVAKSFLQRLSKKEFLASSWMNRIVLLKQDGVPHAYVLLVWGKCSRRLSGLHTGFTDFSCFRYFSHGST